jgi:hypothetical protein
MLDTLRVRIPLTPRQYDRILNKAFSETDWIPVLFSPKNGEHRIRRVPGLLKSTAPSYERDLRWDVDPTWRDGDTWLTVEFSVPKLWLGHNIHLLYGWATAVAEMEKLLNQLFGFRGRGKLAAYLDWQVSRADLCYAWKFPNEPMCSGFLDSLKRIKFPYKKPHIYGDSLYFPGRTYTVKFYKKLPEFRKHDRLKMIKAGVSQSYIDHLEKMADGVLRFEVELRRKYLTRQGIDTVKDLLGFVRQIAFSEEDTYPGFDTKKAIASIMMFNAAHSEMDGKTPLEDGMRFDAPEMILNCPDGEYHHKGGGFTILKKAIIVDILSKMIAKFIGEDAGMQSVDQVQTTLMSVYKPNVASRLTAIWLYVQRFGTEKCKENFGRDAYYYAKKQLKAAGVELVEKPQNVVNIDKDFWAAFRMSVPSSFVTNQHDDFRDSDNVLNFPAAK